MKIAILIMTIATQIALILMVIKLWPRKKSDTKDGGTFS